MAVTDVERLFLQAIMTRCIVSEKLAEELWRASVEAVRKVQPNIEAEQDWNEFFSNVKRLLDPLGLDLKGTTIEDTGEKAQILVNTVGDELAQLATAYTATEITFFKQIVELIVMAPNESYSAGEITCLKEGNQLPAPMKVPLRHGTKLLGSFVANGWLRKSKRSRYSLGPRTAVELRGYLTETYEEENLQICYNCDGLVFKGYRCTGNDGKCEAKVHMPCLKQLMRRNPRCPTCATSWKDHQTMKVVGEGAVRDERREGGSRRNQDTVESEEEGDDDMNIEEEEQPTRKGKGKSSVRGTRSSQRNKRRGEDEDEALGSEDEQDEAEQTIPMGDDSDEDEAPRRRNRKR
ncbi:hypothetical protein FRC04_011102 [Tulasnella sp. 424]|nr:hypothetical protein FRC04_011102 [Tulasnella sp. 424]KAG8978417.1 hypothetical protein FRC05_010662 [Tulasnella sp. 425]